MIPIYDRKNGRMTEEQVFGGSFIDAAYGKEGALSRLVGEAWVQRFTSRAVGTWYHNPLSRGMVDKFIRKFGTDMSEFVTPDGGFRSFNDFFIRQLTPAARPFPTEPTVMGAPAEGRLSVFEIRGPQTELAIKGTPLSIERLVGSPVLAEEFMGGHAFVFRLCPVDYHRFHFPDEGRAGPSTRLGNELHSVNPVAQARIPDVFLRNERQLCLFESRNFGSVVLMEVGAICVGKIVQTYQGGQKVERGHEKGYFAFGGSTTVMLTKKFWVKPDEDILAKTREGVECLVRLGEPIARAGMTNAS